MNKIILHIDRKNFILNLLFFFKHNKIIKKNF
jgi:hypothetical protein